MLKFSIKTQVILWEVCSGIKEIVWHSTSQYNNDSGFITNLTNQSLIINQENSNELAFSKSNGVSPVKTIIEVLNHNNTSTGDKTIYLPQLNQPVY